MSATESNPTPHRRELIGVIVKDKMDKSRVVKVSRLVKHTSYHKYVSINKHVMAHDEANRCKAGDQVIIRECRPLSKRKSWVVKEILKSAHTSENTE